MVPAKERKRRRTSRLSAGGLHLRCRDPDLALSAGPGGIAGRGAQVVLGMGQARLAPAIGAAVGRNNISWLIQGHRVIVATGVIHHYRWRPTQ